MKFALTAQVAATYFGGPAEFKPVNHAAVGLQVINKPSHRFTRAECIRMGI